MDDDMLDALYDLKHDLGKYIRMPVAMLPADAPVQELREALHAAIFATRNTATDISGEVIREYQGGILEVSPDICKK